MGRQMTTCFFLCAVLGTLKTSQAGHEIIFQGSCEKKTVPCDHVCIDLNDGTFECGCDNGYKLQSDGVSCVGPNAKSGLVKSTTTEGDFSVFERVQKDAGISSRKRKKSTKTTVIFERFPTFDPYQPLRFGFNSFLAFSVPDSAYLETNLTLEIQTSAQLEDGLIFYGGQRYGRDFLSVTLEKGNVVLRFDCGEGSAEDIISGPLKPGVWHSLNISRKYCSFSEIDLDKPTRSLADYTSLTSYKGISMAPYLYLGGVPENWKIIAARKAGVSHSFRGCIRKFQVNEKLLFDSSKQVNEAIDMNNIEMCKNFNVASHVKHGAKRKLELCKNKCPDFMECVFTDPLCVDNVSRSRTRTKEIATPYLKVPHFSGDSYVKHAAPSDLGCYLELNLRFKPTEKSGLIFFAGVSELEQYVAIYLKNGYVYFHFDLGNGAALLRSESTVSLRKWHNLRVWRTGKGGLLKIDNQSWIEGMSPGGFTHMRSPNHIYLGGGPEDVLTESIHDSISGRGFFGCLKEISVNEKRFHTNNAESVTKVRECNANPCIPNPCGTGNCTLYHDEHLCLCPYPYSGDLCEKKVSSITTKGIGFKGSSYLKFRQYEVMKQTGRQLTIMFDDHAPETTVSPMGSAQLNVYEALYIGGYLPKRGLFLNSGLRGCIEEIVIGGNFRIDKLQQASSAVNVESC